MKHKRRCNTAMSLMAIWIAASPVLAHAHEAQGGTRADRKTETATGQQQTLTLPAPKEGVQPRGTEGGSITFVGNATVIIRYAGMTILTDPNFLHKGDRAPLGYGLTALRLTEPALSFEQLPPIDLVVLSHMHGDHFDPLVQQKLDRNIPIATTPEAAAQLEQMGFKARHALNTWDSLTVRKGDTALRVSAAPGRHGPPVIARLLPQVMGSILEFSPDGGQPDYRIYISGDTLVDEDIQEIPKRYPDIDLALLHLGGTVILGVVKVTMDGKDGVRMLQLIAPRHAIPIHYNDYDRFKSPLGDFENEVKSAGLERKVTYLKHGDVYRFAPRHP